jgi:hypothetical protein
MCGIAWNAEGDGQGWSRGRVAADSRQPAAGGIPAHSLVRPGAGPQRPAGIFEDFTPRFIKRYAHLRDETIAAVSAFAGDVRAPLSGPEHTYGIDPGELDLFGHCSARMTNRLDSTGSAGAWDREDGFFHAYCAAPRRT